MLHIHNNFVFLFHNIIAHIVDNVNSYIRKFSFAFGKVESDENVNKIVGENSVNLNNFFLHYIFYIDKSAN